VGSAPSAASPKIQFLASFSTFEGSEQQDCRVKYAVCGEISAAAPPSSEKILSVGLRNISPGRGCAKNHARKRVSPEAL
jgi:hypothetical protein